MVDLLGDDSMLQSQDAVGDEPPAAPKGIGRMLPPNPPVHGGQPAEHGRKLSTRQRASNAAGGGTGRPSRRGI